MRYIGYLLLTVGILVTAVANAKCSTNSISTRFSDAQTVVLVAIESSRDGPVPYPYGLAKGAIAGKLLTLRVVKSWKGSLHPDDIVYGWTQSLRSEDSYPITDIGSRIIVFGLGHEIMACNTAAPDHLNEVAEELDAIVRDHATPSLASKACSLVKERIGVHDGVATTALDKTWFCTIAKDPWGENPPDWWVIGLRSSRHGNRIRSNLRGWFAVNRLTNEVREFDIGEHTVGGPIGNP